MKKKVIIFGASKRIKDKCKRVLNFKNLEIIAYIDNEEALWGSEEGIPVISLEELKETKLLYDIILIGTVYYAPLLYKQLIEEEIISKNKIFLLCSPEDYNEIFFDIDDLIDDTINQWIYRENKKMQQLINEALALDFHLNTYHKIPDNVNAWYQKNTVIAHGGGGYVHKKSFKYSNSFEAFEESYKRGFQVIEADFMLTSDNHLVLSHYWNYCDFGDTIPSLKEVKDSLAKRNFSFMTFKDLLYFMETKKEKQIYIITDIKWETPQDFKATLQKLIETVKETYNKEQQEYFLQQFIIQVYNQETFDIMKQLYNFHNSLYTLYREKNKNPIKAAEFCLKNQIPVVTIHWKRIYQADTIAIFKEKNIKVYIHTINDKEKLKEFYKFGIHGYYTDFLMPNDK